MTANNTTTEILSKFIPTDLLPELDEKVKKANRVAKRNGFPAIEVEHGAKGTLFFVRTSHSVDEGGDTRYSITTKVVDEDDYNRVNETNVGTTTITKWAKEAVEITVTVPVFGHDGYRLVGLTKDVEGIQVLSNFEPELFNFDDCRGSQVCDHCNHKRRRNKVYFLAKEGETTYTKVGSSCVKLFFPEEVNALNWLKLEEEIDGVIRCFDEDRDSFGRPSDPVYDPVFVLQCTILTVNEFGYTSRKASEERYTQATTDFVKGRISGDDWNPTQEDLDGVLKQAESIIEWVRTKNGQSDFYNNVNEILDAGYAPYKLLGYIVGIYGCHLHEASQKAENANEAVSEWIGEVKERRTFTGEITRLYPYESAWGVVWFHTIKTEDGNIISHKRNGGTLAEEGDIVEFVATVKEHTEYKGTKQTVVQRPAKIKTLAQAE